MPKFSILSGSAVLNVLLIALNLYADTEVSGAVDGEWTRQGSPYIVTGQIVIDDQDELVINSGVQVLFATDVPFFIYGRLIAVGTMQDSIRFAPRQEGQTWEGLRMIAPDSLTLLSFCVLTNGRSPERERTLDSTSAGGNLFITGGGPGWVRIEHCRISRGRARSMGGGAMVWRASPEFYACLFSSNDCDSLGGALGVRFGSPLIRECRFIGNGSNWGGGAMYLTEGANAIVDNSEFLNNTCSRGQGGTGGAV